MDVLNLQGVIIYHSLAGDNEDHEGDDRGAWKKRIGADREWDDLRQELIPRGHFYVIGCSPFVPGAGVTERVEAETGWVIKRVEKRDGSGRSLLGRSWWVGDLLEEAVAEFQKPMGLFP